MFARLSRRLKNGGVGHVSYRSGVPRISIGGNLAHVQQGGHKGKPQRRDTHWPQRPHLSRLKIALAISAPLAAFVAILAVCLVVSFFAAVVTDAG